MSKIIIAITTDPGEPVKLSKGEGKDKDKGEDTSASFEELQKKFLKMKDEIDGDKIRKILKILDTVREKEENTAKEDDERFDEETEGKTLSKRLFE